MSAVNNVENCTAASGDYQGSAPGPLWGTEVPKRYPSSLQYDFQTILGPGKQTLSIKTLEPSGTARH